jgi:hypothetical protein
MLEATIGERIERWTAISSLALVAVTWRLWTPQAVFPQVPLMSWFCQAPYWTDWWLLGGLVLGLLSLVIFQGPFKSTRVIQQSSRAVVLASLTGLFLLDQHRFQPWAYMLWLITAIFLTCEAPYRLRYFQWLLIGIYFYSGIGKFDFEFLHTVGQQMLNAILKWLRIAPGDFSMPVRIGLVVVFPVFELVLALALMWKGLSRLTAICAILFHTGLILVLGPLGMNHRPGVLIWNIQIALQIYWLFVAHRQAAMLSPESVRVTSLGWTNAKWPQRAGLSLVALAVIMPLFERLGFWDHWPSWALYAPHSSRVHVEINSPAISKLPSELAKLTTAYNGSEEDVLMVWSAVPIDAWSLETLDTPIYPQSRFQLGVARAILQKIEPEFSARIAILGASNRFYGKREVRWLENELQIAAVADEFWFNSQPRGWTVTDGSESHNGNENRAPLVSDLF